MRRARWGASSAISPAPTRSGGPFVNDKAWLLAHVGELSDQQEAPYDARWSTADAPQSYLDVMARGIVGLTLDIARLEGKMKMSQNRDDRDRAGVVQGLSERAEGEDERIAGLVESFRK
jgi:transcriptional regulator